VSFLECDAVGQRTPQISIMDDKLLRIEQDEHNKRIRVYGPVDIQHFGQAKKELEKAHSVSSEDVAIDISGISRLDTAGALLLQGALKPGRALRRLELIDARPEHKALLDLVGRIKITTPTGYQKMSSFVQVVIRLGKATTQLWYATIEFIIFMGRACVALRKIITHPARVRIASITHFMETIGIDALPIIALVSFVISIVIAYQGQVQLKPFGAEQYTVNLIAISILREMGVLLTAIMIAGRSGSAFTAEIGTMKLREEVDALRTLGFDPFELLVLPRIIALLIALPLLTFFADFMGLLGGALISVSLLDISLLQYVEQVRQAATWKDFFVGMIKSPVFAFIIALVGCMHGLKVSGSSESVGKETTASVVQSIFLVLMSDGLFSIYFQKIGI